MKNKYFLTLALAFASSCSFCTETVWKAEGAPAKWEVAENWTNEVPVITMKTVFNVPTATDCLIDIDTAAVLHLVIGDGVDKPYGGVLYVQDGGVLTTSADGPWSTVGYNNGGEMVIEAGGVVNSNHRFHIGLVEPKGPATAILEVAGTLNVQNIFSVNPGGFADWTAEAYITTGGVINTPNFLIGDGGLLDVTGGMLIIGRDMKADLEAYVTAGKLTAEGGSEEPTIEWQITGEGEEKDTTTIVKSSTTVGVYDNKIANKASIGVYPNPAKDVVYFNEGVVSNVQVYSITGEIVLRRSNVSQLNVESLKPGYYIIKSEANRKTYIDKLLVK
jgi:hypothetical protein